MKRTKGRFFLDYGAVVALVVLVLISAIRQPEVFLQPENLRNLLSQNAAVGILAVGMTMVVVVGGIDLSVGSMSALVAALGVLAMNKMASGGATGSGPILAAVGVMIGAGGLIGYLNGWIITLGRVAPFIATLVGLVALRSVTLVLADGGEVRVMPEGFAALGNGGIPVPGVHLSGNQPLLITWPVISFLVVAVVANFVLERTRYGRHLIAVGANERAAHYSAIRVDRVKRTAYAVMGLLAGLAAVGVAARLNSVTSSRFGEFTELDAIAAAVIGGASLNGGKGRIWTTVVGVLILGVIANMLVTSGISTYWQGTVKGVIILLAVLIQRGKSDR